MLPILAMLPTLIGLAGAAAPIVAQAMGASEKTQNMIGGIARAVTGESDTETAVAALAADPKLALEFELAVLRDKTQLQEAVFADMKHRRETELRNVEGARTRDVEVRKLTGGTNNRANWMIFCAAAALIFIIWQINIVPEMNSGVLAIYNMAVGALLKMLGDAFQFEFGSSRSSQEKGTQLAQLLEKVRDR